MLSKMSSCRGTMRIGSLCRMWKDCSGLVVLDMLVCPPVCLFCLLANKRVHIVAVYFVLYRWLLELQTVKLSSSLIFVSALIQEEQTQFVYSESNAELAENYMDRWIISFTQSLVMFVRQEMQGYL